MNRKDFIKKTLLAIGVGAVVPVVALKGEDNSTRDSEKVDVGTADEIGKGVHWITESDVVQEKLIEHPGNFFFWDLLQHKQSNVRCVVVGINDELIEVKSCVPKDAVRYSYFADRRFLKENFYLVSRVKI